MTARRLYLVSLPGSDPALDPINRAAELCDPGDWPVLHTAHWQALQDAAFGHGFDTLDARAARLHQQAQHDGEPATPEQAATWHHDELEALGYALGVTAARVAVRERAETHGAVA